MSTAENAVKMELYAIGFSGDEKKVLQGGSSIMRYSILAWRIPWTKKPGGLHPCGCKELDKTGGLTLHSMKIKIK